MKATRIPVATPGMGRALPSAAVVTPVVQQKVDLRPAGNTIQVETPEDNPFTSSQGVEIVTQASGGGYDAPASMQSHHLMHSYIPGLGEGEMDVLNQVKAASDDSAGIFDFMTTAAQTTANVLTAREDRKTAEAQAKGGIVAAPSAPAPVNVTVATPPASGGMMGKMGIGGLALLAVGLGVGGYMLMRRKKR